MAKVAPRSELGLPRTLEEFKLWRLEQPETWEFIAGQAVMMAPASKRHTAIKGNIFNSLTNRLRGSGCRAFVNGIEIEGADFSVIPDLTVSCSETDFDSSVEDEPVVIVEVLSKSTEAFDRGEKWRFYRSFASLRHYLLVHQERRLIELHTRMAADIFEERFIEEGDVPLPAIGVTLTIDEVYESVVMPAEPAA